MKGLETIDGAAAAVVVLITELALALIFAAAIMVADGETAVANALMLLLTPLLGVLGVHSHIIVDLMVDYIHIQKRLAILYALLFCLAHGTLQKQQQLMINRSNEEDYMDLPSGQHPLIFQAFGNTSPATVQQICRELNLTGFETAAVEDVHRRHPNRQQRG